VASEELQDGGDSVPLRRHPVRIVRHVEIVLEVIHAEVGAVRGGRQDDIVAQ
jgi:hypothetical protein